MVLFLDMTETNGDDQLLLEKVSNVVPPKEFEEFETFEALFQFLVNSLDDMEIVVLRAASAEELIVFKRIRDLMRDLQLLLVIPDRKPETLFLGHLLHPRYLSYEDGNFDDLVSVLEKMLERRRQQAFSDNLPG
ncbi:MAG: hypothetical protein KQH63_10400 [Desulfobulbaceae bacterium]|nr:hypothetical protein [Desulfobulbaceae bacterium]